MYSSLPLLSSPALLQCDAMYCRLLLSSKAGGKRARVRPATPHHQVQLHSYPVIYRIQSHHSIKALFLTTTPLNSISPLNPESMSPSSSRVVLVERCYSSYEWEEAPEDLALSLSQLSLLWVAIASFGGKGQGAQKIGAQLIRIVSKSVATAPHPTPSGARSRGVDQMVRHHAEACAFVLLKISSGNPSPRCGVSGEADGLLVTSLLQSALPGGTIEGLIGTIGIQSTNKGESDRFLWRVLRTCCTAYPDQCVRSALEATCALRMTVDNDVLHILLCGASDSWHLDGENRVATLLLLSWCISKSLPTVASDTSLEGNSALVGHTGPRSCHVSGRQAVTAALGSLTSDQKKSLRLAVSLLSSQLSSRDQTVLGHLF